MIDRKMSKAEVEECVYRDSKAEVEARIKDLLPRMTLKEKVGQMTQIERRVATHDAIKDLSIGTLASLCLFPRKTLLTFVCIDHVIALV